MSHDWLQRCEKCGQPMKLLHYPPRGPMERKTCEPCYLKRKEYARQRRKEEAKEVTFSSYVPKDKKR